MKNFAESLGIRCLDATASQDLLDRVQALGLPHGSERSFKMAGGQLLSDRLLVGLQRSAASPDTLFELAAALGLPDGARDLLAAHWAGANAVFLGCEEAADARLYKVYLEFWDRVRRAVRSGNHAPQLLHLGVKWSTANPGRHEVARYTCHPLLGLRDILRRMRALSPPTQPRDTVEIARSLMRHAALAAPAASFLYLEVGEEGNLRRSFDINLYQAGLRVVDVATELHEAAAHLSVAPHALDAQLQLLGERPLGHLSGGLDRRGREFLSVYAEIAPLPDAPQGAS